MTCALFRHALRLVAVALCATALFVLPGAAASLSVSDASGSMALAGEADGMQGRLVQALSDGARGSTIGRVRFSPRRDGPRFWRRAGSRRPLRLVASRPSATGWCEGCPLAALFARRTETRASSVAPAGHDASRNVQSSPRAPPEIA